VQQLIDKQTPYPAHIHHPKRAARVGTPVRSRLCNPSQHRATLVLSVPLLITLLIAPINAQEETKWSRDELISTAREIMNTARYCALITTNAMGQGVDARTMDAFAPDEKMIVWLATNPRSRKVGEIRRHPRVTLYYFDRENQAYVTIHGSARLVNERAEKARHWKEDWKTFYPNRDKDYLLIKVVPTRLEVVDTRKGIVGDAKSWRPPTVWFSKSS
jgi:general stress protein 26